MRIAQGQIEVVGYPENWQAAFHVNPQAFEECNKIHDLFFTLHTKPMEGELAVAIRRMMDVSFKSMNAVIQLLMNGFDTDAMKIARSMWESEVMAAYLRLKPALAKDYNDFMFVSIVRDIEFVSEKSPDLLQQIPAELLDNFKDQFKIAERFRKRNGKLKDRWTDVTVKEMAIATGREDVHFLVYGAGSGFVHVDITAILGNFDIKRERVNVGPSNRHSGLTLRTAHHAMICLMADVNETGNLGFDADVKRATDAFEKAWENNECIERI